MKKTNKPESDTAQPTRLSADDFAYHARLLAQIQAAQIALSSWEAHVIQRYALGPSDVVEQDGTITRKG